MIIGKKQLHYKKVDSTSEEARRLIKKGLGEGLVVTADTQTKGRGKPGSRWLSPKGNLYFSAVIKPYKNPKDLAPITLLGALAARAMIYEAAKLSAVIKWPNDLRVHGKKVGGVLTERLPSGHIIIGIGINVAVSPRELKSRATSLKAESKKSFHLKRCVEILSRQLDREYLAYLSKV